VEGHLSLEVQQKQPLSSRDRPQVGCHFNRREGTASIALVNMFMLSNNTVIAVVLFPIYKLLLFRCKAHNATSLLTNTNAINLECVRCVLFPHVAVCA
jgi:hypothetical protein